MCLASGVCVFFGDIMLKKISNQSVNISASLKLSLFMLIITFVILQFYEKEQSPILSEPFISS